MTDPIKWAKANGPEHEQNSEARDHKVYRVLAYDRKSFDRHKSTRIGAPESIEARWEAIQEYCQQQGWEIVDFHYDNDVSARTAEGLADMPELAKVVGRLQQGEADGLICYSSDRLARGGPLMLEIIYGLLLPQGIKIHYVHGEDPRPDSSSMFLQGVLAMANRFAVDSTTEKRMETIKGLADKCHMPLLASAPYGYRYDKQNRRLKPVQDELANVRLIFDLYLQGYGENRIRKELARRGIRYRDPRTGQTKAIWSTSAVRNILKHPIYAGYFVWGRVRHKGKRSQRKPPSQWHMKRDPRLVQVVTPQEWVRAQEIRAERASYSRGRRADATPYLLTGLLRCSCGSPMHARNRRYAQYTCWGHKERLLSSHISGRFIEPAVLQEAQHLLNLLLDRSEDLVERARLRLSQAQRESEQSLDSIDRNLQVVERQLGNLRQALRETDDSDARQFLLDELQDALKQQKELKRQREAIRSKVQEEMESLDFVDLLDEAKKALVTLQGDEVTPARMILQDMIDSVVFDPNARTATIHWKLDGELLKLIRHEDFAPATVVKLAS